MNNDRQLRDHLLYLLRDGGAHIDFESVVKDFPFDLINQKVEHVPYTAWQLLEHMRITQWDILEFCRNPKHVSPTWPEGYSPRADAKADVKTWGKSIKSFRADHREMMKTVSDSSIKLFTPIAHGSGQTILREALLVADHNAYHLGVMVTLKRILQGQT